MQQALKRAGVHQTPYGGGPWSIFTHGGGDVVAKAWAVELLKQIGAPTTAGNVAFVYNWEVSEGGGGKFNPLNQGPVPGQPGLTSTGQQYGGGAADFTSWGAGLKGAAAYLAMPDFRGIAGALRANDPVAARAALIQSPWAASHYGYGSGFANQAPPGASIPALPPLLGGSGGGMGGGVSSRLTGPTGPSGTGGGPGSAPSGTGTGGGGGSGRAGTGGGGGQGGGGATGPDPAIAVASGGTIATTAETGTPGPGGGLGSNPILFPFVEGLDLTKQAFTTVVAPGAALAAISNNFRAFLHGIDWLFVPSHWVRILAFFGGVTSVGTGVVFLSFSSSGLPGSHVTKPAALPLGIASVGFGGILLFIAFHNVPTQVIDLPSLLSWLETEFHKGASSAPVSTAVSGVTAL